MSYQDELNEVQAEAAQFEQDDYNDPVKALTEAVALLEEIVAGDKLFDPGTDDEQESRDNLLADYDAVLRRAKHIAELEEKK